MHPPPQGKSWAEGPILQVAYGAPAIRRSPPEARLTDLCEDALRGLPEGERRNTALVVGVLDADVVATSCGRMDPMFKALPKKLATCEDRTGQRVVLGAVLKSAEVLLPPKAGATGPEIRPWSTPPDAPAALLDPTLATQTAPDSFDVAVESTAGPFLLRVTRSWSPHGADRFYNLVQLGFYNEASFFRVVEGFVAQTGISAYPDVAAAWFGANIPDDPVTQSNTQGRVSFATAGPGTRTTQLFICLEDVAQLDGMGFSPFAEVVEGMDAVKRLYADYGEGAPMGSGPDQERIQAWGGAYLEGQFPKLDRILTARVVAPAP
jgi:peptidyl-prolyl cis-trans isomerase A (cyclophilin A)